MGTWLEMWRFIFILCFCTFRYVAPFDAEAWSDPDSKRAITRIISSECNINASTALLDQYTADINCTVLFIIHFQPFWLRHDGRLFLYFKDKIFMVLLMAI